MFPTALAFAAAGWGDTIPFSLGPCPCCNPVPACGGSYLIPGRLYLTVTVTVYNPAGVCVSVVDGTYPIDYDAVLDRWVFVGTPAGFGGLGFQSFYVQKFDTTFPDGFKFNVTNNHPTNSSGNTACLRLNTGGTFTGTHLCSDGGPIDVAAATSFFGGNGAWSIYHYGGVCCQASGAPDDVLVDATFQITQ